MPSTMPTMTRRHVSLILALALLLLLLLASILAG
jgi:hypothetical protein